MSYCNFEARKTTRMYLKNDNLVLFSFLVLKAAVTDPSFDKLH